VLGITTAFSAAVITHASTEVPLRSTSSGPLGGLLPSSSALPSASLPVSTSGLPVLGGTPTVCVPNVTCTSPPPTSPGDNGGNGGNGDNGKGTPTGSATPASQAATATASAAATATPAGSRIGAGQHHGSGGSGLNLGPPPSVLAIGPASSLSFGKAPFLWPVFAVLDALGLGGVVWVVRKTWSRTPAD
jgi:hypothetical protein